MKKETENKTGSSPRFKELSKEGFEEVYLNVTSYSKKIEQRLKSTNNWLTAITILLVASFAINVFLYSISIKQRTDILNLQDTIEEKNRIIKQYKFKNNEQ